MVTASATKGRRKRGRKLTEAELLEKYTVKKGKYVVPPIMPNYPPHAIAVVVRSIERSCPDRIIVDPRFFDEVGVKRF